MMLSLSILLLSPGSVYPNPGPNSINFSIAHLNVGSLNDNDKLSEIYVLACLYEFDVCWILAYLMTLFSFLVIVYPWGKIGSGSSEEVWQFMPKITLQLKDVLNLNTLLDYNYSGFSTVLIILFFKWGKGRFWVLTNELW